MSKDSIYQLVEDTVHSLNFILIESMVNYGKLKDTLKVIIYHPEKKITSDDCTSVADIISRQLDIDDPFDRPYDLIVESPGLEREIKSLNEYRYFINREFKLFLNEDSTIVTKEGFVIGKVISVTEEGVTAIISKTENFIPFNDIKKAKLYCDYTSLLKKNK